MVKEIGRKSSHIFVILLILGGIFSLSITQTLLFKNKWSIEVVDDSPLVGDYSSIALDSKDNPHISYMDKQLSTLKYAKWNGNGWDIETVDNSTLVGEHTNLLLDANDNPHIVYSLENFGTSHGLRYARYDGNRWIVRELDTNSFSTNSVQMDSDGNLIFISKNEFLPSLNIIYLNGDNMESIPLETIYRARSYLDIDDSDIVHVVYSVFNYWGYANTSVEIYYGTYQNGQWQSELIENKSLTWNLSYGSLLKVIVDSDNNPHIFHLDEYGALVHRVKMKEIWSVDNEFQVVPSAINLDSSDNLHIIFKDSEKNELIHAFLKNEIWSFETIIDLLSAVLKNVKLEFLLQHPV